MQSAHSRTKGKLKLESMEIKNALHKREGHFLYSIRLVAYAPNWNRVNDFTIRLASTVFKKAATVIELSLTNAW